MNKRYGVAIIGGSGYGAGELLRFLAAHPEIEACHVVSRSHTGKTISSVHSHLESICQLTFDAELPKDWWHPYERAAVICAMPAGHAAGTITELLATELPEKVSIIDLSGDLRLRDKATHQRYYPEVPFASEIRSRCVYGLSELNREEIRSARLISNPGCLASASILALAPIRELNLAAPVIIDAKTGTSGAGREPQATMHHPSRSSDFTAYKILEHRHEAEIAQALGSRFSSESSLMFVPHLIPTSRGIYVTAYVTFTDQSVVSSLASRFGAFYEQNQFIRLRQRPPRLVDVVGTNFCDINISTRGAQVVISATLDNLGKGMAGQCIQNLNLMFGLPESCGLMLPALGPA